MITGADPAFCSGDDVKQIMVGAGDAVASGLAARPALTPAADALLHTDVPIVAAVNGAAVGWGMELAAHGRHPGGVRAGQVRRAVRPARASARDVPGIGRLAQLVGRERAAELLFTGRVVDADEAQALGLVSRVVPHDELLPTALDARAGASPPTRRSPCSG